MFDNICKFLAENFCEDLASWLLGSPVQLTELSPTELSSQPIRADSLILLQSDDLVLHSEFQTDADETIPFRMLDYRVRVYRRFPAKAMRQVVIYLRKTESPLVQIDSFRLERTFHEFDVIRLWEQPTEKFLEVTGLLPFAVLSQTDDPTIVLSQVAQAVERINDRQVKSNIAAASGILAGLVLQQEVINQILRSDIMRESVIYRQILEEGLQQGRQQGRQQEAQEIALNMLRAGVSPEQITQFTKLSLEAIQVLQQQLEQENN